MKNHFSYLSMFSRNCFKALQTDPIHKTLCYLKRDSQLLSQGTHPCQASLIVGSTSSNINVHSRSFQLGLLRCKLDFRFEIGTKKSKRRTIQLDQTFSLRARIIPLKVAATSVKLAIPPPIRRALFRPSGSAVAHCKEYMVPQQMHYFKMQILTKG